MGWKGVENHPMWSEEDQENAAPRKPVEVSVERKELVSYTEC